MPVKLQYIATGTGRCGTQYMSNLLSSLGIPCAWEIFFTSDGITKSLERLESIETQFIAEASYMAAPYLKDLVFSDAKIIHLVRNPIDVINSFVSGFCYFLSGSIEGKVDDDWQYEYPPGADKEFQHMKFIYEHIPELRMKNMNPYTRAAWYYIRWNEMIERNSTGREYYRHRIEDKINGVLEFINKKPNVNMHDDKSNHVEYKKVHTLESFPFSEAKNQLIDIGKRYGYFKVI